MTEAFIIERLDRHVDRVREHSAQHVNRRIARAIERNVEHLTRQGRDAVMQRLRDLDREWDIDRVLMANFAILGGAAYGVGLLRYSRPRMFGRRRNGWLYLFASQLGFLMMHASVGWCPPVVVWRRLGVRTKTEIDLERTMLEAAIEPPLSAAEAVFPQSARSPQAVS